MSEQLVDRIKGLVKVNVIAVFLCLCNSLAWAFTGGDGTELNPYQIATAEELQALGNNSSLWNKHFIITADIDMAGKAMNPIGSYWTPEVPGTAFTGSFNGGNFVINNLLINLTTTDYVGLFGYTSGAEIYNTLLANVSITGNLRVGGLAGCADNHSVYTNCYVEGNIHGTSFTGGLVGDVAGGSLIDRGIVYAEVSGETYDTEGLTGVFIGGLVGVSKSESVIMHCYYKGTVVGKVDVGGLAGANYSQSIISNSYAIGRVSGDEDIGGLVGFNNQSTIFNCYTSCHVLGQDDVGGLVGWNYNSSSISNCYATGEVNGNSKTGGLVGFNTYNSTISNGYAIGKVTGNTDNGGVVGWNSESSTVLNCYWNVQSTGQSLSSGSLENYGLSEEQFRSMDFSTVWPFGTDDNHPWQAVGGGLYPILYSQRVIGQITTLVLEERSAFVYCVMGGEKYQNNLTYSLAGAVPNGMTIGSSTGVLNWTPTEDQGPKEYTVTIQVSDGNTTDSQELTLKVLEVNNAPELPEIFNSIAYTSLPCSFSFQATDTDSSANSLTYSLLTNKGATIDGNGLFSWTPTTEHLGENSFTVQVSDGFLTDSQSFTVTVKDSKYVIGHVPTISIDEETTFSYTVISDDDYQTPPTFSLSGTVPAGLSINAVTGELRWTPTEAQGPANYAVTLQASDGSVTDSQTLNLKVLEVNKIPVLEEIADVNVEKFKQLSFSIGYTDLDIPANIVSFGLVNAPTEAQVNPQTGEFSWTPVHGADGLHSVTVTLSDGETIVTKSFIITVSDSNFAGGLGTFNAPYQISNIDQLSAISSHSYYYDKYFVLTSDIDASASQNYNIGDHDGKSSTPDQAMGFKPIGDDSIPFTGSFDGGGFTIRNLFINRTGDNNIGLFGVVGSSANIRDVDLESCNIKGRDYVGGLSGQLLAGTNINNVLAVDSSVKGQDYVGGIAGYTTQSITSLKFNGTVNGVDCVGGLLGAIQDCVVSSCSSSAEVSGQDSVGGLIGLNSYESLVYNSFTAGSVRGEYEIGGLVGLNWESEIKSSYANCSVVGEYDVGGLVGYSGFDQTLIRNCYTLGSVAGVERVGGIVGAVWDINESEKGSKDWSACTGLYNSYAFNYVQGITDVGAVTGYGASWNCYYKEQVDPPYINSDATELSLRKILKQNFGPRIIAGEAPNGAYWEFGDDSNSPWFNSGDWSAPSLYWEQVVTSYCPISVSSTRAVIEGAFKTSDLLEYGVEISLSPDFASTIQFQSFDNKDGVFETDVMNLSPGTTYYYRSYFVGDDDDLSYGRVETFTTLLDDSLESLFQDTIEAQNSFSLFLREHNVTDVDPDRLDEYQEECLNNAKYLVKNSYYQLIVDAVNQGHSLVINRVYPGWNLISSPFENWRPSQIFNDENVTTMYSYDSISGFYQDLTSLDTVVPGKGYWFFVHPNDLKEGEDYVEYVMTGTITNRVPYVINGWNLIGPVLKIGDKWGSAYTTYSWNTENQSYDLQTDNYMYSGIGYWLHSNQDVPSKPSN